MLSIHAYAPCLELCELLRISDGTVVVTEGKTEPECLPVSAVL